MPLQSEQTNLFLHHVAFIIMKYLYSHEEIKGIRPLSLKPGPMVDSLALDFVVPTSPSTDYLDGKLIHGDITAMTDIPFLVKA
jgi:hypothetical protein